MTQAETMIYPFPTRTQFVLPSESPKEEPIEPIPPTPLPKGEKRKQENLLCDTCGIEVNSTQMMESHVRGQKHIKKLKLKTGSSSMETVSSQPSGDPIKTENSINSTQILQLVNETAKYNKITAQYDLIRETGPAHCKQFDIQLTLGNEIYVGSGTSIKRAQYIAAEEAFVRTALIKPDHVIQQLNPRPKKIQNVSNSSPKRKTKIDNFFNEKYLEISEDHDTIVKLHHLVEEIERALKSVSDTMMEMCKTTNIPLQASISTDDPSESFRMLKGAMKISSLAMDIYLKESVEYELVVICAHKPNEILLNEIHQELMKTMSMSSEHISYQIHSHSIDMSLTIESSQLPRHLIRILLTSSIVHSDLLNEEEYFDTITEIRMKIISQSNWVTKQLIIDQGMKIIFALLHHLQNNRTPLMYLNHWCLVLLVYHCHNSSNRSLTDLLRQIFACISAGLFLPNQQGVNLFDPCDDNLYDPTAYLTPEQCLDITRYGQIVLRFLSFEQFDHIFSFQRFPLE